MASVASDIRKTAWGPTLVLSLVRAAAGGLVFGSIGIVGVLSEGDANPDPMGNITAFAMFPFMMPLGYLLFILPIGLAAEAISRMGVPYVGFIRGFVALFLCVGDPILWTANKLLPGKVPGVRSVHFRFFNFTYLILVFKAADDGLCRSCGGVVSSMADSCPQCDEPDPWEAVMLPHAQGTIKSPIR